MYSDTHCHIFPFDYNVNDIFDKLDENGLKRIICNGYDKETNEYVLEYANKYENVYGALGIHPDNIDDYNKENLDFIKNNILNKKIISIGEIGLDYYHNKENKTEQIELFEEMLNIAESVNKPVIIHNREATPDVIAVLKKHHVKGIIHSFSGSYETAQEFIKMGFKLGIGGVVTFKNSNLPSVVEKISIDNLLIETDSPCLTPHSYRGELNEPKYVSLVANKICEIKKISSQKLAEQLEKNFFEIFDI